MKTATIFRRDASDVIDRREPVEVVPSSWNPQTRTLEVVFASGTRVSRMDARGAYAEVLGINQDFSGFVGRPVLNSHRRDDLDAVLGHVVAVRTEAGKAVATIKLSDRAEPIVQDILAGHIRGVSCGYTVQEWSESRDGNGARVMTATKWTPVELSLVAIPADPNSVIRTPLVPADRAGVNAQIRSIAHAATLDQRWIDRMIDTGVTVEAARAAAFEELRVRSANGPRNTAILGGIDYQAPEIRARHIGEAIYARIAPAHTPSAEARGYIGLTIPEIARLCLRNANISTTGSAASVIDRALMTTSDFPLILADAVGRTLRTAYGAAPSGIRRLGRQSTLPDFRKKQSIMLGSAPTLEKVNEHGEFRSGALGESAESYGLATFGRIIGLTRQALVNDDLNAFGDLPRRMGAAAAAFEADFLVTLLTSNSGTGPTMSDTKALFHSDHGNLAGSGAAPGETTLDAARLAMRGQVEIGGELIAVTPRYLLVGPALETACEKLLAAISPTTVDEVQPIRLALVVEPRLSGNGWYVVADPAEIDGLEYAYLEGESGPQLASSVGWRVDGVELKVRLDFGAGFVEHRGWYRNAGA